MRQNVSQSTLKIFIIWYFYLFHQHKYNSKDNLCGVWLNLHEMPSYLQA